MEVKPGYKQTEVGVIPEEWDVKTLGDVGSTYGGLTGKTKADFGEGPARYITFMNVMSNVVIDCGTFEQVQVSPTESQNRAKKGDLFLNGSSESPEEVAMCSVLLDEVRDVYLNSFCFGFRFHDGADADGLFLAHYLRSKEGRELMKSLAQGSTRYNLSKVALLKSPLRLPKLSEQTAIATALSDVDGLLGGLDRLIAKKRDLKQAAMQQLLTGQTRLPGFHGEWVVKQLGSVADVLKGNALSKSLVSASGTRPCILYGELFTTYGRVISEIIARTNSSEGCLSVSGDLLMPGSTTTTGADLATASALLVDNVALGGDIIVIRRKDQGYDPIFMANYLTQARRHEIAKLTQGITIHHLYGKDVKTLSLRLPSLPEQTAIAEVLTEMDAELAVLEQRWEKTRALKQTMMQELLTGRTRLV